MPITVKFTGLKPLLEIVDVKKYFNTSVGFTKKPLIKAVDTGFF
jgi:ABC-type oligopeptide transport system ATPase subunit